MNTSQVKKKGRKNMHNQNRPLNVCPCQKPSGPRTSVWTAAVSTSLSTQNRPHHTN